MNDDREKWSRDRIDLLIIETNMVVRERYKKEGWDVDYAT